MKKKKESNEFRSIFILPALILLFLAVIFRLREDNLFYGLDTSSFTAQNITVDTPFISSLLWDTFKKLFTVYIKGYLLPVYLLLMPAIFLLSRSLSGNRRRHIFTEKINEKKFLILLFIISFLLILGCHFFVIGHHYVIGDEFCYIFQADMLASGKLYGASPPCPDSFHTWSIINDGRWYSKVTTGWPFLLAFGRIMKMDFIINPFFSALSLIILYLFGKTLLSQSGGLLAVFFAFFSPLFFLLGSTYFPHNTAGFLCLLFTWTIIKSEDEKGRFFYPIAGGITAGLLLHIRPGDGIVMFLGNLPLIIYLFLKSGEKQKFLLKMVIIFVLFFVGAGLLLLINKVQNGDFFLFGYEKYDPEDRWGFGVSGHTPLKGLWNTVFSFMRNSFWTVPFIVIFTVLSFFRKEIRLSLVQVPAVLFIISYFGFYSTGAFEIGARYYLPLFMLILVPASGGLLWFRERWEESGIPGSDMLIPSLMTGTIIFMVCGVYPSMFPAVNLQYKERCRQAALISNYNTEGPSLIFLKKHADKVNMFFTRNLWQYRKQKNIMVLYLTPPENKKVIENFPGRKIYMTDYDKFNRELIITENFDNSEKAENYLLAAYNYMEFDRDKAIQPAQEALKMEPNNPEVLNLLGMLYDEKKEYDKALPLYEKLSKITSWRDHALYQIGLDLGEMGKIKEAIETLEKVSNSPDKTLAEHAQKWIEYYEKK